MKENRQYFGVIIYFKEGKNAKEWKIANIPKISKPSSENHCEKSKLNEKFTEFAFLMLS